jgi:hypothetical protein
MNKNLATLLLLFSVTAYATDNSIYIDQSGDSSTISITQTGASNIIRGTQGVGTNNTTRSKIYGNSNNVTVRQIGTGNTLDLGVVSTIATGRAAGTDITYHVTGNTGVAKINSNNAGTGTSASNLIDVRQTGNTAGLDLTLTGSKNSFIATTTGGASNTITGIVAGDLITNNIAVSGGGSNAITLNLTSSNADNSITLVGASNTVGLTQSGTAGVEGHAFTLSTTGSSNAFTVDQSGTNDTTVNILSAGSGNTWNITTGN